MIPDRITIYFDGGCYPKNPGGTAQSGWAIVDDENNVIVEGSQIVAEGGALATNNYAEYRALELSVQYLVDKKWKGTSLTIKGDSKLVVEQVNKRWKCKSEHLKVCLRNVLELLSKLDIQEGWSLDWIRRSQNKHAHSLTTAKEKS